MIRVAYDELFETMFRVLLGRGFESERAELCARLFADASRDGFASHGLDRFPRFIETIENGVVDINARPVLKESRGALERWDGCRGPGNLNAFASMNRAIELTREFGLGCVALANTNHWMRGGSYGWQAADAGAIGICWTNTMPNLPAWGATDPRLGNNPLIIAVPRRDGHVVLDMAMSQFSFGALSSYRLKGEPLPVPGGFDEQGQLTRDPATIEQSRRPLPIGYWKGAGLALMLDMVAAVLAGGNATHQILPEPEKETGLSQVFVAIDTGFADGDPVRESVEGIIEDLHRSSTDKGEVRYPGERTLKARAESLRSGVPVEEAIWKHVQTMKKDPGA